MATTSDQCALRPDGKLLDASDIIWLNDPDNLTPIPPKSPIVHPFFCGGPPPASMVAGSRQSARVSHPSKHVLDPDNSERPDISKQPCLSQQKRVVIELDSDESDGDCVQVDVGNRNDGATDTEGAVSDTDVDAEMVDSEAVEEAYAATKAMGDADHEVC